MGKSSAFRFGEAWARRERSGHVDRLADHAEQLPIHLWDSWFQANAFTPAELLFFVMEPDHAGDRLAAACFYDRLWRENGDITDADFVKEFAEGMLAFQPA